MFIRNLTTFYVNSYYMRIEGSTSKFSIKLELPQNKKYNSISVSDIVIPKSWKLIDSENNTMILIEDGVEIPITFDVGNYSVEQFMKRLSILLTNASLNSINYVVRMYKSNILDTGLMQFQADNNTGNIPISFKIYNNLSYLLGFDWPLVFGTTDPIIKDFVNDILISEQTINFAYTNNLYLTCDKCSSVKASHLPNSNILTIIYNYSQYNSYYHHDQDFYINKKDLTDEKADVFNFQLIDEYGKIVNLENLDISFNLHIFQDDYEDFKDMIKNGIKYNMLPEKKKDEYLLFLNNPNNYSTTI